MEAIESNRQSPKVQCSDEVSDDKSEVSVKIEDDGDEVMSRGTQRENRLTSIIDQLRCQSKMKGNVQRDSFAFASSNGEGGGGGGARRCARDAASPAHAPPPTPTPAPHAPVKSERLSPHDSNASRSRSVTPSTSSYPGTPPERGSPHAAPPASAHPPRNYSDIMRSLAARYNSHNNNDYFHRMNGFGEVRTAAPAQDTDAPLGGLFTKLASKQGGPPRLPAFPVMLDMSSTKTLLAISRVGRGGRSRRKRHGAGVPEHSPLDLSAAGESAAKRARLSASPSTRSDSDDRDRVSNDDRSDARGECLCAEARARLSAWSVDEVCDFINTIDICAEYATNFREQRIDGSGLPLLTEDHLTGMLQMKLGPALKLRAVLSRRLEPCAACQASQGTLASQGASPRMNGAALKPEPRSNTTSPS
ncbi:polyhomeotic-like protein 3 isoform X1 [Helicoverpa armigera]|uniref:polyhomeotic-like protein 3 isoform X1 n=1 Tax=Helicoverpa armigera TaxID=29058 RepID=UPI0030834ED4